MWSMCCCGVVLYEYSVGFWSWVWGGDVFLCDVIHWGCWVGWDYCCAVVDCCRVGWVGWWVVVVGCCFGGSVMLW